MLSVFHVILKQETMFIYNILTQLHIIAIKLLFNIPSYRTLFRTVKKYPRNGLRVFGIITYSLPVKIVAFVTDTVKVDHHRVSPQPQFVVVVLAYINMVILGIRQPNKPVVIFKILKRVHRISGFVLM